MSKWISGGLLALVTVCGIAYVLADKSGSSHCGPCVDKPTSDPSVSTCDPISGTCPSCTGAKSNVIDVADLNRFYNTPDGPRREISFEEPPYAKPRGEVTPVKFETPSLELAPMPRLVD